MYYLLYPQIATLHHTIYIYIVVYNGGVSCRIDMWLIGEFTN